MTEDPATGMFSDAPSAIRLFTRGRMNPLDARPEDIHIEDIAHSLARLCRYNGHVGGFLSVARHSIWVADELRMKGHWAETQMIGLLHDAAEAYLGDMVRPLKHGPAIGDAYLEIEARLERVIAQRFDIEFPFPASIAAADNHVLLHVEMGGPQMRWTWDSAPQQDEETFLARFEDLQSWRDGE